MNLTTNLKETEKRIDINIVKQFYNLFTDAIYN